MAEINAQRDATRNQQSLTATDNTVTLSRFTTWGALGFQVTGTWTGTITFECTVDGATWAALSVTPSNSATAVTTTTANGVWGFNNNFFQGVRARFSTASSGIAVVTIVSRPSQS